MQLTDQEKEKLKAMIDRGEKLPQKYKSLLFENVPEVELVWAGKTNEVTNVVLPFQSIEQIDEPRKDANMVAGKDSFSLFSCDTNSGRQKSGWSNKLIWGDNKLVLSSLKNGPMRDEIEKAGGLKLVYIDPPFDVGADFSFDVEVGDESITKEPSLIEELAYRDTWGRGPESYLSMIYERLKIMQGLISEDGSIYVHIGTKVSYLVRCIMDDIFGNKRFINSITWKRTGAHNDPGRYGMITDNILYYSKSETYNWNQPYGERDKDSIDKVFCYVEKPDGTCIRASSDLIIDKNWRRFQSVTLRSPNPRPNLVYDYKGYKPHRNGWAVNRDRMEKYDSENRLIFPNSSEGAIRLKMYLDESPGVSCQDIWTDIKKIEAISSENLYYDTQKPEALLERIIKASSNEGDLVADFFFGSGTTLAVAEKLGRKWIGCDLGRFAIHTTRKRMIGVQRELKASGKPYRSFEILNLGKYERQYFAGIDPTLPDEQRRAQTLQREEHYLTLILSAYKAERIFQLAPFHGKKGATVVLVGPIDAPVTLSQVNEAIDACRKNRISKVDILGFEFEMGLVPAIQDEARQKGVTLSLKYIPKDVFDRRAIERNQVKFYDVAFVEVMPKVQGKTVQVQLKNFGVFYRQDDLDSLGQSLKNGGSKVTIDGGQVVKITKDKNGVVTRDVLTKKWTDWIDYWAVDFDYESRKELITLMESGEERQVWTGNYIFENEWQSFRTKNDRNLELMSGKHEYPAKGKYKIAVKVIDIFGNDTTKVVGVTV